LSLITENCFDFNDTVVLVGTNEVKQNYYQLQVIIQGLNCIIHGDPNQLIRMEDCSEKFCYLNPLVLSEVLLHCPKLFDYVELMQ
jgi:hypothetical protein